MGILKLCEFCDLRKCWLKRWRWHIASMSVYSNPTPLLCKLCFLLFLKHFPPKNPLNPHFSGICQNMEFVFFNLLTKKLRPSEDWLSTNKYSISGDLSALWFVSLMPSQTTLKILLFFLTWCFCQKEKAMLKFLWNQQNMKTKVENNVVNFQLKVDEIRRFYSVFF